MVIRYRVTAKNVWTIRMGRRTIGRIVKRGGSFKAVMLWDVLANAYVNGLHVRRISSRCIQIDSGLTPRQQTYGVYAFVARLNGKAA